MKHKGFTLIEIILSISVIGILSSIVIIAINPQRQLAQTNNLERFIHVNAISKALYQYGVDNHEYPSSITNEYQNICATDTASDCIDLAAELVPKYLSAIPKDRNAVNDWTGYQVAIHPENNKLSLRAVFTELDASIAVNPFRRRVGEVGTFTTSNTSITGTWETIEFRSEYVNPIIIGAANSSVGNSALVFDSRNITSTGAEVRLCHSLGPTDGCGNHTDQTGSYMVLDLDVVSQLDGIEAGRANISGGITANWNTITFTEGFTAPPIVLASPMDVTGDFSVEARVLDVDGIDFQLGLCHQRTDNDCETGGNYPATDVAWVAINPVDYPLTELFDSGVVTAQGEGNWSNISFSTQFTAPPAVFVENITNNGAENGEVAEARNITTTNAQIRFCEVDNNNCDSHADEDLNWLALPQGMLTERDTVDLEIPILVGEVGTFTSSNSNINGTWQTINFTNTYTNPIVLGSANSSVSNNSALVFEARNVTENSAEMRLCHSTGPVNGCQNHTDEVAGYVVIDLDAIAETEGIEGGRANPSGGIPNNWRQVNFTKYFGVSPLVFTSPQEIVGDVPLETRVQGVNSNDFEIGLCHQRNDNACETGGNYPATEVAWLALQPGTLIFEESFSLGVETGIGNSNWANATFSTLFNNPPAMIVENQTNNGNQNGEVNEARNITVNGAQVRYCELDAGRCDGHNGEDIAWFAAEQGNLYVLQPYEP
jgi:prepilin-type N-terminal cleavage/methylation domain-containing protein